MIRLRNKDKIIKTFTESSTQGMMFSEIKENEDFHSDSRFTKNEFSLFSKSLNNSHETVFQSHTEINFRPLDDNKWIEDIKNHPLEKKTQPGAEYLLDFQKKKISTKLFLKGDDSNSLLKLHCVLNVGICGFKKIIFSKNKNPYKLSENNYLNEISFFSVEKEQGKVRISTIYTFFWTDNLKEEKNLYCSILKCDKMGDLSSKTSMDDNYLPDFMYTQTEKKQILHILETTDLFNRIHKAKSLVKNTTKVEDLYVSLSGVLKKREEGIIKLDEKDLFPNINDTSQLIDIEEDISEFLQDFLICEEHDENPIFKLLKYYGRNYIYDPVKKQLVSTKNFPIFDETNFDSISFLNVKVKGFKKVECMKNIEYRFFEMFQIKYRSYYNIHIDSEYGTGYIDSIIIFFSIKNDDTLYYCKISYSSLSHEVNKYNITQMLVPGSSYRTWVKNHLDIIEITNRYINENIEEFMKRCLSNNNDIVSETDIQQIVDIVSDTCFFEDHETASLFFSNPIELFQMKHNSFEAVIESVEDIFDEMFFTYLLSVKDRELFRLKGCSYFFSLGEKIITLNDRNVQTYKNKVIQKGRFYDFERKQIYDLKTFFDNLELKFSFNIFIERENKTITLIFHEDLFFYAVNPEDKRETSLIEIIENSFVTDDDIKLINSDLLSFFRVEEDNGNIESVNQISHTAFDKSKSIRSENIKESFTIQRISDTDEPTTIKREVKKSTIDLKVTGENPQTNLVANDTNFMEEQNHQESNRLPEGVNRKPRFEKWKENARTFFVTRKQRIMKRINWIKRGHLRS